MACIEVVGLGPAGEDLVTAGTLALIAEVPPHYLRTVVHPAAAVVGEAQSFDHLYESAETFEDVYAGVVEALSAATREHGRILYAVPGSPVVAERTVELLLERPDLEVVLHPALSFLDLAWVRLGIDPVESGVTVADGHRFAEARPSVGGAVLVAQCESRMRLSDIKLAVEPPPARAVLLHHLGLPDEQVLEVDWADIDRTLEADHLTSLWVPDLPPGAGGRLDRFAGLMADLRREDPWKAAQTHDSLRRFMLEEAHEVLEALDAYDADSGEGAPALAAELGDLLYQVVFHAALGEEAGWFDLADVVAAIQDKLESRHPHLAAAEPSTPPDLAQLVADWERAKVTEHGRDSAFEGIPAELPALLRALKVLRKAEALGLALPPPGEGTGARLFAEVQDAAARGDDPEDALRRHVLGVEAVLREQEP